MPKKHPSDAMIKDLAETFAKHNWSGQPIGLSSKPPQSTESTGEADECPPGTRPQWVTYKLPDGTWATKKICV
jgi:hypothetical protein